MLEYDPITQQYHELWLLPEGSVVQLVFDRKIRRWQFHRADGLAPPG